jgi:hypothetical protein
MKRRDKKNLKFLLEASPETLDVWYKHASQDDLEYADSLLTLAEIEFQDKRVQTSDDCTDAQQILDQFRKGR